MPSDILCEFFSRRLQGLQTAQSLLFKLSPPNYGILTSILTHLIRNIPFAIPSKKTYLTEALRDLNHEPIIERFGMFFLHDFDVAQGLLPTISQEDNGEVVRAMVANRKGRKRHPRPAIKTTMDTNTDASRSYPLGERPTWDEVRGCLQADPLLLMRPWVWKQAWDVDEDTSELFVQFTVDFWLTLEERVFRQPLIRQVTTLEEAMGMWSISAINERLLNVSFLPNSYGISERKSSPSSCSFQSLASTYFPDPEVPMAPNSPWRIFRERGYLRRFGELKAILSDEDFATIKSNLSILLGRVQALPYSLTSEGNRRGRLWKSSLGTIDMLTNPQHYKLCKLSSSRKSTKRVTRVKAHPTTISVRLDEAHLGISIKSGKRRKQKAANLNKSAQSRNRRHPPKRKGQPNAGPSISKAEEAIRNRSGKAVHGCSSEDDGSEGEDEGGDGGCLGRDDDGSGEDESGDDSEFDDGDGYVPEDEDELLDDSD
jgi:hypothetical protein